MTQKIAEPYVSGQGMSGDNDFFLCKARVYAQHCWEILMTKALPQALLKSRQVNANLSRPVAWHNRDSAEDNT